MNHEIEFKGFERLEAYKSSIRREHRWKLVERRGDLERCEIGVSPVMVPPPRFRPQGDEILDFYQPDEDLKVEDVLPGIEVPMPDEIAEIEKLRRCVRDTLSELPRDERRALTLCTSSECAVTASPTAFVSRQRRSGACSTVRKRTESRSWLLPAVH